MPLIKTNDLNQMRHLFIILISLLTITNATAQPDTNDLRISILTCADGDQMYASFGHCAIRAKSESRGFDFVYNYGMFNYKQKSFYLKFVRGFLNYHVSYSDFARFCLEYVRDGREIREQVLNLNAQQRQAVFDFLNWNCLEENRYYRYNFLEDNCATRIRDIVENTCGSDVHLAQIEYTESFRDMIHSHLGEMPWFRFGVDLLMGLPVDRKADSRTAMFLPEHVFTTLEKSTINHNGVDQPLISETNTLLKADPVNKTDICTYLSPSLIFWLIFAVLALSTYYEIVKHKHRAWIDRTLLIIVGLFGLLFLFMWFGTEHTVTKGNLNLLWALPTHIAAAFAIKSQNALWKKYFFVTAVITLAVMVLSPLLPQQFDVGNYPLMCILILRLAYIAKLKKN